MPDRDPNARPAPHAPRVLEQPFGEHHEGLGPTEGMDLNDPEHEGENPTRKENEAETGKA